MGTETSPGPTSDTTAIDAMIDFLDEVGVARRWQSGHVDHAHGAVVFAKKAAAFDAIAADRTRRGEDAESALEAAERARADQAWHQRIADGLAS